MLETLDKQKIQNKIKCELCMYKYNVLKKINVRVEDDAIMVSIISRVE